jgi:hypothetical protein
MLGHNEKLIKTEGSLVEIAIKCYKPKVGHPDSLNYGLRSVDTTVTLPVTGMFTDILLDLTNGNHDVIEFQNSFIQLQLRLTLLIQPNIPILQNRPPWIKAQSFPNGMMHIHGMIFLNI